MSSFSTISRPSAWCLRSAEVVHPGPGQGDDSRRLQGAAAVHCRLYQRPLHDQAFWFRDGRRPGRQGFHRRPVGEVQEHADLFAARISWCAVCRRPGRQLFTHYRNTLAGRKPTVQTGYRGLNKTRRPLARSECHNED